MSDDNNLNNQLATVVDGLRSQSEQPSKPKSYKPESRQVNLINALWDRMTQLYRARWTSAEGEKLEAYGPRAGQLTQNFLLWCRKTESLTNEQWAKGFEVLEKQVEKQSSNGETPWPPTYAEFIGLCKCHEGEREGAYGGAHKLFYPNGRQLPEPQEYRSRRKQRGIEAIKDIKQLFEE